MAMIFEPPPLESPLQENPLPVPDDSPDVTDVTEAFPHPGPEGENDVTGAAGALGNEISISASPGGFDPSMDELVERLARLYRLEEIVLNLPEDAVTAFRAIIEIVEDGEIDWEDPADRENFDRLESLELSPADRTALLEAFDAAVANGFIPPECEVADNFWEQQNLNNCAVVAQKMVLDAIGIPNSEGALTIRAWIDGSLPDIRGGMHAFLAGEILERHGVSVHTRPHLTLSELEELLREGHMVIVGVDAEELWFGDDDDYDLGLDDNHAVVLLEIDTTDPDNPVAVMNDSGSPEGAERRVPLQTFMDAWADSGNFAVVTAEPLEQLRLVNPDVQTGLDALIAITGDGQINLDDEADAANLETLLSLELNTSDLFVLIERFDAAFADGTIPFDCEIADSFWEEAGLSNNFIEAQTALLDLLDIPHSKAHLTLRAFLDGSLRNPDPLQVGAALELFGISSEALPYATVDELRELLAEGRGIIAVVDAHELRWVDEDDINDGGTDANHAVLLLDIDLTDPDNPVAVISDGGIQRELPLETFLDAFADSDNFAIVTEEPLEQLRREPPWWIPTHLVD